nr:hypothetical protein [Tanacetum cinerariifolium]
FPRDTEHLQRVTRPLPAGAVQVAAIPVTYVDGTHATRPAVWPVRSPTFHIPHLGRIPERKPGDQRNRHHRTVPPQHRAAAEYSVYPYRAVGAAARR